MSATVNIWQSLPRPFFVLAPMEDVTDTVFRRLVSECGRPDLYFSEFTSADGLCSIGDKQVAHRFEYLPEEKPLIAQIWGNNPENYCKAAKRIAELGFDGIDINMGCPVGKVVKSGQCSALIENPALAKELLLAAQEGAAGLPVSIKTRLGFRDLRTLEWMSFLLELEPAAITVHGRIAKHLSTKPANWDEIGKVVALRNEMGSATVIVGNGDVSSRQDGLMKVAQFGVDGVMVGRGIFQNLFLFNNSNTELRSLPVEEKLRLLLRHVSLFEEYWQGRKPYRVLKKFFKIYVHGFDGASALRAALVESQTSHELRSLIRVALREHGQGEYKDRSTTAARCLDTNIASEAL